MHSRYRRGLVIDGETVHTGRITRRTLLVATAALLAGAEAAQARRLTPKQARALRAAVRGRVLTPASSGYDAARVVFNRRYDHVRPPPARSPPAATTTSGRPRSCRHATAPTCAPSSAGRTVTTSRSSPAPAATATTATRPAPAPSWSTSTR